MPYSYGDLHNEIGEDFNMQFLVNTPFFEFVWLVRNSVNIAPFTVIILNIFCDCVLELSSVCTRSGLIMPQSILRTYFQNIQPEQSFESIQSDFPNKSKFNSAFLSL